MKPLLASDMKIGDFTTGQNDNIVPQLLMQLPTPNSFTVTNMVTEGENVRITTNYTSDIMPEMKRTFLINKEGKIIEFDVLEGVIAQKKKAEKP